MSATSAKSAKSTKSTRSARSAKTPTSPRAPHTRAWHTFEENLEGVGHMVTMTGREIQLIATATKRLSTLAKKYRAAPNKVTLKKLTKSADRWDKAVTEGIERFKTAHLWQVVMLVTCVEGYLQDLLSSAAIVDPDLMSKSEQMAPYATVAAASSLEDLMNEMRGRWARGWLNDGGPTQWLTRLEKMGVRGYAATLAPRLELIWGIRHVVVHAGGVSTADFVRRHPGMVGALGDRVRVPTQELKKYIAAVRGLMEPTEAFFLARWPALGEARGFD